MLKVFPISAVSRQGLKPLLFEIADLLEVTPEFQLHDIDRRRIRCNSTL